MITNPEELASAGYRQFRDGAVRLKGDVCERLWQKKVEDDGGVRYFVNVFEWDLKKIIPSYPGQSPSFQAEVQFTDAEGRHVDVSLLSGERSMAEAEAFFERMFVRMGFVHAEPGSWTAEDAA